MADRRNLQQKIDAMLADALAQGSASAVRAELDADAATPVARESPPELPAAPIPRGRRNLRQAIWGLQLLVIATVLVVYSTVGTIAAVWTAGVSLLLDVVAIVALVASSPGVNR